MDDNNIFSSNDCFDLILLHILGRSPCCELYQQLDNEGYRDNVYLLSNIDLFSNDILQLLSKDDKMLFENGLHILNLVKSKKHLQSNLVSYITTANEFEKYYPCRIEGRKCCNCNSFDNIFSFNMICDEIYNKRLYNKRINSSNNDNNNNNSSSSRRRRRRRRR